MMKMMTVMMAIMMGTVNIAILIAKVMVATSDSFDYGSIITGSISDDDINNINSRNTLFI